MNLHQEHHFEREICAHLAADGWLHAEGDAALFDRAHGLFLPDLLAWVQATQPESWQRLAKTHGAALVAGSALRNCVSASPTISNWRSTAERSKSSAM